MMVRREEIGEFDKGLFLESIRNLGKSSRAVRDSQEEYKERIMIYFNDATTALEDAGIDARDLHGSSGGQGSEGMVK